MCTSIVEIVDAEGAGKGEGGWFVVTRAVVSWDHPHHALLEEAITIDFLNPVLEPAARVAVELTLQSAKALSAALAKAIAAAELEEHGRAQSIAAQVARLSRADEEDALNWIEAVSDEK